MVERRLTRRSMFRFAGTIAGATALAACGATPTPQVVEKVVTQVVEKEVTKLVEGTPQVVKETVVVQETVVVEVEAATQAPKTVTFSHWQHHSDARAKTVEQFQARFEDEHPGVTIDFQSIPWSDYWGKLASGIAAGKGSAPDVFQIPMGLVEEYVAGDNLVPISDLVISPAEIEDTYLPWTVQRGKREGQYYGLPLDVQTLLIYRHNALFAEAGLDVKADFVDHQDMYDVSMKLTKKAGDVTDQVGMNTSYYCAWMTTLFQQFLQREKNSTPWIDPKTNQLVWNDYPEIFGLFEWFCTLSTDTDDSAFMSGQNRFALGKEAMNLSHPVSRGSLKLQAPDLEYTISKFAPRVSGTEPYTAGSHWMWVVGKWAPDFETCWQWVYYCTNKPAQIVWNDVGGDLPSHKGLVDDPAFRTDDNANVCMDSLKYATPWEWVGWAEWVKETQDARDRVVVGGEDTSAAFATMVDNLNKVIETHTPKA
jgi:multiple sugar transport system substrate-binding protein